MPLDGIVRGMNDEFVSFSPEAWEKQTRLLVDYIDDVEELGALVQVSSGIVKNMKVALQFAKFFSSQDQVINVGKDACRKIQEKLDKFLSLVKAHTNRVEIDQQKLSCEASIKEIKSQINVFLPPTPEMYPEYPVGQYVDSDSRS